MTWQEWVAANLPAGTVETSGYRTPQQEAALGGPSTSYHTRGTPEAPGAIDVGGPAAKLKALFDEIKQAFAGRINELYLNLPAGGSQDIRHNQPISYNPEAGRPQHLHIAIGGPGGPVQTSQTPAPAMASQTSSAAMTGECVRSWHLPQVVPWTTPTEHCWSDTIIYGAAVVLILGGAGMVFWTARAK